MVIEIAVSIIAAAMVVWMTFLMIFFLKLGKKMESAAKDIHGVSTEALKALQKIDSVASDVKSVSGVLLHPEKSKKSNKSETLIDTVNWVTHGLVLFNKIRKAVRHEK